MGRFEKEASKHIDKIRYYYKHAGEFGFSQAENHYRELSSLIKRAHKSKKDKNDVVIIQKLHEEAEQLMQKMKQQEEACDHSKEYNE